MKHLLTFLLVCVTATASAQSTAQLAAQQRKTSDSLNNVIRLIRWQANRDSVNIVTLQAQVKSLVDAFAKQAYYPDTTVNGFTFTGQTFKPNVSLLTSRLDKLEARPVLAQPDIDYLKAQAAKVPTGVNLIYK